jgi:hypothetical protein
LTISGFHASYRKSLLSEFEEAHPFLFLVEKISIPFLKSIATQTEKKGQERGEES